MQAVSQRRGEAVHPVCVQHNAGSTCTKNKLKSLRRRSKDLTCVCVTGGKRAHRSSSPRDPVKIHLRIPAAWRRDVTAALLCSCKLNLHIWDVKGDVHAASHMSVWAPAIAVTTEGKSFSWVTVSLQLFSLSVGWIEYPLPEAPVWARPLLRSRGLTLANLYSSARSAPRTWNTGEPRGWLGLHFKFLLHFALP